MRRLRDTHIISTVVKPAPPWGAGTIIAAASDRIGVPNNAISSL